MENIDLISLIISCIGITMLIISLLLYIKRTKDKSIITKFWAQKKDLVKSELIINRVGLSITLIGIFSPNREWFFINAIYKNT